MMVRKNSTSATTSAVSKEKTISSPKRGRKPKTPEAAMPQSSTVPVSVEMIPLKKEKESVEFSRNDLLELNEECEIILNYYSRNAEIAVDPSSKTRALLEYNRFSTLKSKIIELIANDMESNISTIDSMIAKLREKESVGI